jgi:AcrR family transcriptional regulator
MLTQIKLSVPTCAYLRDPQETKLGVSILTACIDLMDDIGFEAFNFKKLAKLIGSTEASVYRYFRNKYQVLLYIHSWYWGWMHFKLIQETQRLESLNDKLNTGLQLLIAKVENDDRFPFIDQKKMVRIIECEGTKLMLHKQVDSVNKEGAYENYSEVIGLLSDWLKLIAPNFQYPKMLLSTIIEGAHIQHFFTDHLPHLTNKTSKEDDVALFFMSMLKNMISCHK